MDGKSIRSENFLLLLFIITAIFSAATFAASKQQKSDDKFPPEPHFQLDFNDSNSLLLEFDKSYNWENALKLYGNVEHNDTLELEVEISPESFWVNNRVVVVSNEEKRLEVPIGGLNFYDRTRKVSPLKFRIVPRFTEFLVELDSYFVDKCKFDERCSLRIKYSSVNDDGRCEPVVKRLEHDEKLTFEAKSNIVSLEDKIQECRFEFKTPYNFGIKLELVPKSIRYTFSNTNFTLRVFEGNEVVRKLELTSIHEPETMEFMSNSVILSLTNHETQHVKLLNRDIFEVVVTNYEHRCVFMKSPCDWNKRLILEGKKLVLMQSTMIETTEENPACLLMKYSGSKDQYDLFYVIWETSSTSTVLYKDFGNEMLPGQDKTVEIELPRKSSGKIRSLFRAMEPRPFSTLQQQQHRRMTVDIVKVESGPCKATSFRFESGFNCQFNGTLCGWRVVPNGLLKNCELKNESLELKPNSQLISPELEKGTYCLGMEVGGKGQLTIILRQTDFYNHTILDTFLIASSKGRARHTRYVPVVANEGSRIVLRSRAITHIETSLISIFKTSLVPPENCGDSAQVTHELLSDEKKLPLNFAFHTSSEMVCFNYSFFAATSLNSVCLEFGYEIEHPTNQVMHRQCSTLDQDKGTVCIRNPGRVYASYPLMYVESTNHPKVYEYVDVLQSDLLKSGVMLSNPWGQDTWECYFDSMDCGWSQPTLHNGHWSIDKEGKTLSFRSFSKLSELNLEKVDYLYSPEISGSSNSSESDQCVTFKLHTHNFVVFLLKVKKNTGSEETVLIKPNFRQIIDIFKSIQVDEPYRLAFGIAFKNEDPTNVAQIKDISISDGPCVSSISVNCEFDDGDCGWNRKPNELIVKSDSPTDNRSLFPEFDCNFEAKGFGRLYSADEFGNVESYSLTSPSSKSGTCVSFCFYMNGIDRGETKLNVNEVSNGDEKVKWSVTFSQENWWYRVQFPVSVMEGEFSLRFFVESDVNVLGPYAVAIDSVSVREETNCKSFQVPVEFF